MTEIKTNYYTVKELAKELNKIPDTIRRDIRNGKLKAIKVNNSFLIEREEAERFIKACRGV